MRHRYFPIFHGSQKHYAFSLRYFICSCWGSVIDEGAVTTQRGGHQVDIILTSKSITVDTIQAHTSSHKLGHQFAIIINMYIKTYAPNRRLSGHKRYL